MAALGSSSLATTTWASTAHAAEESVETEALLRRGIQLRRDGADEAALAVFLEAETQSPNSVRVLLHVATAAQAASKWLLADEYMRKAAQHEDDPYYQRYRAEIEEVRAATAQRVGQFRAVGEPRGAEVRLNGQVIGTLPMTSPKSVEAGTYVLEVSNPGFYRLRRPISVPGAVLTRETVHLNVRAPGSSETEAGGASAAAPRENESWLSSSWLTWSLAGVGVAGLTTSSIALLLREREVKHWNDEDRCLLSGLPALRRIDQCGEQRNNIDTFEQVAIISGGVGVAFLGAAITQWLTTRGDDAGSSAAAQPRSARSGSAAREPGATQHSFACTPALSQLVCSGTF